MRDNNFKYNDNIGNVDPTGVYLMSMFISLVVFLIPFLYMYTVYKHIPLLMQYILSINISTIVIFGFDKYRAVKGEFRVPEASLHTLEALGGTPGAFISMIFFNHKISKLSFLKKTWIIILLQATAVYSPTILTLPVKAQVIIFSIVITLIFILSFIEIITEWIDVVVEWIESLVTMILILGVVLGIIIYLAFLMMSLFKSDHPDNVNYKKLSVNSKVFSVEERNNINSVKKQKTLKCKDYFVNVKSLNLRAKKTTNSDIVGKLFQNEKICVSKNEGSWAYINARGWVYEKYITML